MEGAGLEIIFDLVGSLIAFLIYPIIWIGKKVVVFWRYMDPSNLPETMTFDEADDRFR